MNDDEFNKALRNDILARESFALDQYGAIMSYEYEHHADAPDQRRMDAAMGYAKLCQEDYRRGLPRVAISACPFCAAPFMHTFDPYDLDGEFWTASVPASYEPKHCAHVCFFRGAVAFGDLREPKGPRTGSVQSGPEVPYVIPKQLDLAGVVAVIGELAMEPGWQAYPIVYFADPVPAGELLTSNWREDVHVYVSSRTGGSENGYPNDPWDFDLAPWIARGKLRWCLPGEGNTVLADPSQPCPYVDLPGHRGDIRVSKHGVEKIGSPDGSVIIPFE